jgi:hypothetical protein
MAPEHDTNDRTWADDIEADLPPILAMLEATGAPGLDDDTCAYALVLTGRARQLSRPGDELEALANRAMPHVAALLARAPLLHPVEMLDRADAALMGEDDGPDDPLDALLDGDDWLTTHGLAAQAQIAVEHDPVAFGEHFGAIVSACPDRVVELRAFADARVSGMEARAHEAPAWEALLDIWSAVVEAAAKALVDSLPVAVQGVSATVEAMANAVFSKFPVWLQVEEEEVGVLRNFVRINTRPFTSPWATARGRGLRQTPAPVEIARWDGGRLILTSDGADPPGALIQLDGRAADQRLVAERDGEPFDFECDEFDAEIALAPIGRYCVTVGEHTVEFELQDWDESEHR